MKTADNLTAKMLQEITATKIEKLGKICINDRLAELLQTAFSSKISFTALDIPFPFTKLLMFEKENSSKLVLHVGQT